MLEGGDDIRNDNNDGNATAAGRPVVSLLEKYSSLSRGIDQARSEYAQRQLEIESIEGEIEKITDNDRPVADEGIETAILEKQTILLTLEDLMTKDLIEAEGSETLAKSNLDFIKSKEANAVRAFEDDQRKFLVSCKTFRDKVTNLSLRGECFGLTTPVAPLGAYAILRLRTLSKNRYKVDDNNDDDDGGHDDDDGNENENDNDENFQLIDDSLLLAMNLIEDNSENNSKKNRINNDKEEEDDDDEEIQDMLRQLREQEVRNEKYQKLLQDEKNKQSALQDAKDKRESQKKDLQSQCERLQRDIRDVQDQIENLKRQTKEAQTSAIQFRNDVERGLQNQASALAKATYTTSNTTIIPTTNATAATRRKISYNPYAPANRRPANTSSRTISPVMDPTAPTTNTSTNNNNSRSTSRQRGIVSGDGDDDGDDGDGDGRSRSPLRNRQQAASVMAMAIPMTQTAVPRAPHQQFPHRSGKVRSSRHFGGAGTSFRAPGASLLRNTTTSNHGIVRQTKNNRHNNNNTNNNSIWEDDSSDDSSQQMNGQKRRRNSSMLQELEDSDDSDDDNDDDNVWLNAPPTFSSSTKRKQN